MPRLIQILILNLEINCLIKKRLTNLLLDEMKHPFNLIYIFLHITIYVFVLINITYLLFKFIEIYIYIIECIYNFLGGVLK